MLSSTFACGATTQSCPDEDTKCGAANDDADGAGGSSDSAAAGGSGGSANDGSDVAAASTGSIATGGSSATATSMGAVGGNAGTGGSTSGGLGGSGGSPIPMGHTPGAFECGESDVPMPVVRLTHAQYDNTILDLLGLETLNAGGTLRPSALLSNDPLDTITELGWEGYRTAARQIAEEVVSGPLRANFITCEPAAEGCLSDTIVTFGRKAFRRPLTEDERADYARLIPEDPMEISDTTAVDILATMLASPSFLWRLEQGGFSEPALTSYEVASRLSYFMWNGPPDAELSQAADADQLGTAEQLAAQATRMLEDPRLLRSFEEFHRGYLNIARSYWGTMDHDQERFPLFSTEVNQAGLLELARFLDDVVASNGTFQDLFLSNIGFVNQHTAPLYGLSPGNFGSELVRVELEPKERPGLLTRLAFLSSFSGYASTHPILRGIFVSQHILNLMPGPPLADLPPPLPPGEYQTNRELVTALTASPACAQCHQTYIDPIGFVLENYDAVGAWQTIDPRGGPIDPVADVFFGDEIATVHNSLELMQKLASSRFAHRNYADEAIAYAFSRPPNAHDACLADVLADQIAQGISLRELWFELAQSDEFRFRGAPTE